jgi:hypothetical protein
VTLVPHKSAKIAVEERRTGRAIDGRQRQSPEAVEAVLPMGFAS